MKASSKIAVAIIALLLVGATIAVACTCGSGITAENFGKMITPPADKDVERTAFDRPYFGTDEDLPLDIELPEEGDTEGLKAFAYTLYSIANQNHQKTERVAIFTDALTTTRLLVQDMNAIDFRYTVKDADKYFYAEYSFAADEIGEGLLGIFSPESTLFAYMYYTDATMEDCYGEKIVYPMPTYVSEAEIKERAEKGENIAVPVEKNVFNVDWNSDDLRVSSVEKPVYYAGQTEKFEATGQKILPETIKNAEVEYNEDEGYYTIRLELDCDNPITTQNTIGNLREGFGNDTAHYTTMIETIEIWDNGYFKNFLSEDSWTGTKVIPMDFILRFDSHFCYYGDSLEINAYQNAENLIAHAKKSLG